MSQDGVITQVVIGTADGSKALDGMVSVTPVGSPNIKQQVITPIVALTVRFINVFLVSLAGSLPVIGQHDEFRGLLHLLIVGSATATSIATVALIKDLITIFRGLENKYPLLTGNV